MFPKRKQEGPQKQCHINKINMIVYFCFNVYQSSHDPFYCVFNSDFQYKTLICYCFFIRMLTSQFSVNLIWHNTMHTLLLWFVCLFCCELYVNVAKFYNLAVILTVPNDVLDMTPQQNYHVTRNSRN